MCVGGSFFLTSSWSWLPVIDDATINYQLETVNFCGQEIKWKKIRSMVQFTSYWTDLTGSTDAKTLVDENKSNLLTKHLLRNQTCSFWSKWFKKQFYNVLFVFGACAKAPKGFIFFTVSEPILCILRAQYSFKTESLKWNDVENPVCLKLAVRDALIYHRGWEASGDQQETFNVNKSYFCHFVLLPSRVIILE